MRAGEGAFATLRHGCFGWKQFRAYFVDVAPGRSGEGGATLMGGIGASAAPMNGYPKVFNIESDPHEGAQHRRDVQLLLAKIIEDFRLVLNAGAIARIQ
jgi:hypothetical protein